MPGVTILFIDMLRLLYLLLDQHLRRHDDTPPLAAPALHRRRTLMAGGLVALIAGIALVSFIAGRIATAPPMATATAGATLELRVDHIGSAPLVIFLESPDAIDTVDANRHAQTARLTSVNSAFQPAFQVASLMADIDVGNDDAIPHNTHVFDGQRTVFNVATPTPGVRVRKQLRQPGIFGVRCDLHPWMRAWVFVPANPHYAVMWQPGSTTLRDVPPGEYRLHAWDPVGGQVSKTLTLDAGETKSLSFSGG